MLFLVDDNLFVRDFALATAERALREHLRALGFSLRLEQNTRYCYPYDAPQALPAFEELGPELLRYAWRGAAYDFGYPLEVSSSLYRVSEVLPFLRTLAFANPNTMEAEMANHVGVFAESHPDLLCFPLSVTFCNPLNMVQSVWKNRAVALPAYASQVLAGRFQRGDRIEAEWLDGYVPDGCHNEVPLTLLPRRRRDDEENRMTFSIVVPCFNQGRYLTDCLESLAFQSVLPTEVIVVNDGSTDAETNALCARLGQYRYPFPVRSLSKPNGGPSSARNHGIQAASGAIIVPLDGDDKLLPHALEAYRDFLTANPEIDICFPDILHFGIKSDQYITMHFNRWRLLYENMMVCSNAIRLRVFDAGYWYDEQMHPGIEDWEFWIRTCGLGPFRAAPLKQAVFGYRQWGFSISSATNLQAATDQMRGAAHGQRSLEPAGGAAAAKAGSADASAGGRPVGL